MTGDRPLRSVLFMPADNARAVEKARGLACDAVVLDLEDAVAPERKAEARAAASAAVRAGGFGERLLAVRVNALDTDLGADDLTDLYEAPPHVVVAPKVWRPDDIWTYAEDLPDGVELWAMIESCAGVLALREIASAGAPLSGLVFGANDLAKDMRLPRGAGRAPLLAAMAMTVTAARANGLVAIDGVFNAFQDAEGFAAEAAEGRAFGFDGKSLIHPSQVEPANAAFSPSVEDLAWAAAVAAAFAEPENAGRGAVRVHGAMAERLHLDEAERMLRRATR